jgi:Xaa-Pro aminopeptidase
MSNLQTKPDSAQAGRRTLKRDRPPAYPEHPRAEHDWRVARLRNAMRQDEIDVLLFARNPNVFYVTGTRFVFVRTDAPRGLAPQSTAILTADDLIYCQRFGPFDTDEVAIDTTWADTFELYDSEERLPDILREHGVRKGQRVGTEWGTGLCVGINPIKFQRLIERIESETCASIVDGTAAMKRAMAVKSQHEIDRMKAAVAAAAAAMQKTFEIVEPGMNALDISRKTRIFMLEAGADTVTHSQVLIEDGSPRLGSCDAVDRQIGKGYFHMDIGCTYRRYGSDIHRGIFLGRQPTSQERRLYDCRVGVSELMDRSIAPGVHVDDVLAGVERYVVERGCEIPKKHGHVFAGHSIGLETYQGPSLASSASQPEFQNETGSFTFEPGMMFTYEIPIRLPGLNAFFNIEDDVVITKDGVENMNSALTRELRVKL